MPGARRGLLGEVCRGGGLGASSAGRLVFRRWSQSGRALGGRRLVLNLSLNLSWGGAWLFLGEVADYATLSYPLRLRQPEKVGLWRGLCEDTDSP
jgi:hypothetical protein